MGYSVINLDIIIIIVLKDNSKINTNILIIVLIFGNCISIKLLFLLMF